MALHIRDARTDSLVRELAMRKGVGLTEAVREAVENELAREQRKLPLRERIKDLTDRIEAAPNTGFVTDKAFLDELWGQGDD